MSRASGTIAKAPGPRIAVIGAGFAGCAAAVELAQAGCRVELFEAAKTLGGRARQVEIDGKLLDNGQHILLGAYSETLRLMRLVGVDAKQVLLRLPLQMRYPDALEASSTPPATPGGMDFIAPRLPAPLHLLVALLRARGLSWADKMALSRFSTTCRWMDWQLNVDCSVSELLQRFEQTEALIRLMWRPLCLAALNTPPERASARVFLRVLQDSLGARRSASDMLLPRCDLSALLPQPAIDFMVARGGVLHLASPVRHLRQQDGQWQIGLPNGTQGGFDGVIIATTSQNAARLLASVPNMPNMPNLAGAADVADVADVADLTGIADMPGAASPLADWDAVPQEAISTCYLQYAPEMRLPVPLLALQDQPQHGVYGQFVFDRGQLLPQQAGLLAVVVSGAAEAIALPRAQLAQAISRQLAHQLKRPELAEPRWQQVISEKRATFACEPNQVRPAQATGHANLWLAGDYTEGPYPATLEGAVRSGVQAARLMLQSRP